MPVLLYLFSDTLEILYIKKITLKGAITTICKIGIQIYFCNLFTIFGLVYTFCCWWFVDAADQFSSKRRSSSEFVLISGVVDMDDGESRIFSFSHFFSFMSNSRCIPCKRFRTNWAAKRPFSSVKTFVNNLFIITCK